MSSEPSKEQNGYKESLSYYYDGFKHISTLSIATALLAAALFRDTGLYSAVGPFFVLGVTLVVSLVGMYRIAMHYAQGNVVPRQLRFLFATTIGLFIAGIGNLAYAPLILVAEGTRIAPVLLTLTGLFTLIVIVAAIVQAIRARRLKQQRNELLNQLREADMYIEDIRRESGH